MSILDGLPAEIADALGDVFRDGVLKVPGAPTPDGQGGTIPGDSFGFACKALVTEYSAYRRQALGIPASDKLVIILAASVEEDQTPKVGHTIEAADPMNGFAAKEYAIIAITPDPAAATYECQAR